MSTFIKNDSEWCQIDPIQPPLDEIKKMVADMGRPWHPLLRGLKLTKCGSLIGGSTHPRALDACPECTDCLEADKVNP